jgi:hypothetical protein
VSLAQDELGTLDVAISHSILLEVVTLRLQQMKNDELKELLRARNQVSHSYFTLGLLAS